VKRLPLIRVAAAVIRDGSKFLLAQRPGGRRQAGFWEFPGGKIEPGETAEEALSREIREELGVEIRVGALLRRLTHRYEDCLVELSFHEAEIVGGPPRPLQVAALSWRRPDEMPALPILAADLALVEDLRRLVGSAG
jgi:8-oxo-dGTP diphosphatase